MGHAHSSPSAAPLRRPHEATLFKQAKQAWVDRHHADIADLDRHNALTAKGARCMDAHAPSAFVHAQPDMCPPGQLMMLGGDHGDGTYLTCMDRNLRKPQCVAYLVGAGKDITYDVHLAIISKCQVVTIDPTPGLQTMLAQQPQGVATLTRPFPIPHGVDGAPTINVHDHVLAHGVPSNWQHLNVGIADKVGHADWATSMYLMSHRKWVNRTLGRRAARDINTTVEFLPIRSLMRRLGHARVEMLKLDIEGAEWPRNRELLYRTTILATQPTQVGIELHTSTNYKQWFDFYQFMMEQGFTLLGSFPARYNQHMSRRSTFKWLREHNFTGCGKPMGEFFFYRRSHHLRYASWRYASLAEQREKE